MSTTVAIIVVGLVVSLLVGVLFGRMLWKLWDRADDYIDDRQRALNKLENSLVSLGVDPSWIGGVMGDLIVGDEESVAKKSVQLMTNLDNKSWVFENIMFPIMRAGVTVAVDSKEWPTERQWLAEKCVKVVDELDAKK